MNSDVAEAHTVTSPSNGLGCPQATDCDHMSLSASTLVLSLTRAARPHTPAEQVREVGVLSEAVAGAEVMLGEFFTATPPARPQSHTRILPGPARFRQPGQPGDTLAAAEVIWAGNPGPGQLGGFPS